VFHRAAVDALKPGGLLIYEAFRPDQVAMRQTHGSSGGPETAERMVSEADLRADFAELEELTLEAADIMLDAGRHKGPAAVVHGVWRKDVAA